MSALDGVAVRGVRLPEALLADVHVVVPHRRGPAVVSAATPARRYLEELASTVGQTIVADTRVYAHPQFYGLSVTTEVGNVQHVVEVLTLYLEKPLPTQEESEPGVEGPNELADYVACQVLDAAPGCRIETVPQPFVLVTAPVEMSARWSWPVAPVAPPAAVQRLRPRGFRVHTRSVASARQVTVRLTRLAPSWTEPELAIIRVCTHLWGATPSSRLFTAVRASGLAYAPYAGILLSPFTRWTVSFSCSPGTVETAVAALRRAVLEGADAAPRDARGWEQAVGAYENASAMSRLNHEATMRRLVDRALVGAPHADDLSALRAVDPELAHHMWRAFLDVAEMDLVVVAAPESIESVNLDFAAPDHASLSPDSDRLRGMERT
ncbi:insulinase family protein [Nocardioides sp. cx-173]|uniref:insulinase family protein n=1 Tax=Nocardioides sp. cx-173 TaxID=2898796 RepID=UPI001E5A0BAA|nr:insulinase family protein [Nocardioides sp. cx-173]MCD4525042.1 insulinase family protein [Nocardioides sp. cx-173]UGB40250.1 insulinase family protein [Nocardioides sp. cx-173]